MNFINPELNFKNKSRNIKTRDIYTSKQEHINDISQQHFPFLNQIFLGNVFKVQIQIDVFQTN